MARAALALALALAAGGPSPAAPGGVMAIWSTLV
jgi:hypothetical protein